MTERTFNLVVPLAQKATDMRISDTSGTVQARSGAVSPLIGASLRRGDVDSTQGRSTQPTQVMPGIRTSTTAGVLTTDDFRAYSPITAEKKAVRVESLFGAANSRTRNVCGFFISSGASSMAGRAGKPQGLPVLHRSLNPVRSVTPFESGLAGSKPQLERT